MWRVFLLSSGFDKNIYRKLDAILLAYRRDIEASSRSMTLTLSAAVLWTHGLIGLSIIAAFLRRPKWVWIVPAAIACGLALYTRQIQFVTLVFYGLLYAVLRMAYRDPAMTGVRVVLVTATLFALCVIFLTHQVPGVERSVLVSGLQLSALSRPFDVVLSLDKSVVALLFVAVALDAMSPAKITAASLRMVVSVGVVTIPAVFIYAWASGLVALDVKIHGVWPLWAITNLLFVSLSEECVFRGFLQRALANRLERYGAHWRLMAVLIIGLFFGATHLGGGTNFAVAATVAGIGYGYVYERTRSIELAVALHFLVNATHFVFFTYPGRLPGG